MVGARQVQAHRGAVAGLGVELDVPARLLHEAVHHAQPEAAAEPRALGRVERLERARELGRRHAGAGVGDRHHHVLAGQHVDMPLRVVEVDRGIERFERDLAALGHRITRVEHQVQHRRLELHRVDQRRPLPGATNHFELDVLGLDWVITGCERAAKQKRQSMNIEWVREIDAREISFRQWGNCLG